MKIYMLAGLGFDKRAFQNLEITNADIYHLDWIEPLAHEQIAVYASRMIAQQIKPEHREKEIIFIGHSFGGVLVQEIALQLPKTKLVILISSIKSHQEKPLWMRYFFWIPIYWLITKWIIRRTVNIWSPWYGYKTKESRQLLLKMAMRFSNRYQRWASRTISWWQAKSKPEDLRIVSLHGTKDRMFPYKNIVPIKYQIKGGNHFMCYHEAEEVSKLIKQELDKHQISLT